MEPNKSPNHALEGSSSESSITSGSSHSISSSLSFSVGTYVMASWRNNFEYLAEILAVRQRARSMLGGSGDRCEYKLRFVWDHIIEWTPASRLRAASRFEIDYVLKFCREHGGEGAGKTPPPAPPVQTKSASESPLTTSFRRTVASTSIKSSKSPQEPLKKQGNHPVKSNGTSKKLKLNSSAKGANSSPQIIENHPDHGITSVTSISSTRKPRSGRNLLGSPVLTTSASSTDPATCRSNANNISSITSSNNVPTSGATTHLISAPLPFSLEGSVELDDMVYDRSVAQFHEACRKRRQLKRQAIEQERQQSEQSSRKCDVKGVFTDTTTPLSGSFSEESMCDVSKEPPLMPVSRLLRHFEETEVS
ncbi:unnamed protein product [Protopolystoma xenopodis]|uniref:Chromo domain-containing protein n=1 Tax=Protopolystoma xenopodis TaxID=117903 RepID=A0A448X567_9PLAT|nr:unnamed protein product [Protopolystoma xenopodis]